MAIKVTYINGPDAPQAETFDNAATFMETNQSLVLFSDRQATAAIIAYAPGVWLTCEVV